MVEVTRSSSNGGKDIHATNTRAYDLLSWQGLSTLLTDARGAGLSAEKYNDLRDTVLAYAQSGGDEALKQKIDEVIRTFGSSSPKSHAGTKHKRVEKREVKKPHHNQSTPKKQEKKQLVRTQQTTLGQKRAVPIFKKIISTVQTQASTKPAEVPVSKQPIPQTKPQTPPKKWPVPENLPIKKEVVKTNSVKPQEPPRVKASQPTSVNAKPIIEPVVQKVPVPHKDSEKSDEIKAGPTPSMDESKRRISEIKREVNARVGNPVTLVESGNQVGKEYMNALLAAMKASAGGQPGALLAAMTRLEKAREDILKVENNKVETKPDTGGASNTPLEEKNVQDKKPMALPPLIENLVEKKDSNNQEKTAAVGRNGGTQTPTQKQPQTERAPRESSIPLVEIPKIRVMPKNPPSKVAEESKHETAVTQYVPSETVGNPVAPDVEKTKEKVEAPKQTATKQNIIPSRPSVQAPTQKGDVSSAKKPTQPAGGHVQSEQIVSEKKQEKQTASVSGTLTKIPSLADTPEEHKTPLPKEASKQEPSTSKPGGAVDVSETENTKGRTLSQVAESVIEPEVRSSISPNQSELSSPEITAGLNQLLKEWTLFKSSGFMGIGPSGAAHPLYKRLAPLSMFAVIAGRWEEATPSATQSIKDYVNGWRHEQGVTYNPSETFEHYLRRVVSRILRRQNQTTDA